MTETFTPGSNWLLPVTMDFVVNSQNPAQPMVVWWMRFLGERLVCADPAELNALIPACRLADLEAEVVRLRAGLTAIWDDTYPRSHQLNGQCKHDRYIHEQCEECIWDYAHTVLNPQMEAR
jgi:hypothetical protein